MSRLLLLHTIEPNKTLTWETFLFYSISFQFSIESMCSIASLISYPRHLLALFRCKTIKILQWNCAWIQLIWSGSSSVHRMNLQCAQLKKNVEKIWRSAEKLHWMLINYDNWFSQLPCKIPLCKLPRNSFTFFFVFHCVLVCLPFIDNFYACTIMANENKFCVKLLNVKLQLKKNHKFFKSRL